MKQTVPTPHTRRARVKHGSEDEPAADAEALAAAYRDASTALAKSYLLHQDARKAFAAAARALVTRAAGVDMGEYCFYCDAHVGREQLNDAAECAECARANR